MRDTTFNGALSNQPKLQNAESKDLMRYYASITLAAVGGLVFLLLGFFLSAIFIFSDGNNAALNYAGVSSLIAAYIFFGVSAHFMDKSEENKH